MNNMVLGIILDLLLVNHSFILLPYPILHMNNEIKFYCGEYNSLVLHLSLSPSLFTGDFGTSGGVAVGHC